MKSIHFTLEHKAQGATVNNRGDAILCSTSHLSSFGDIYGYKANMEPACDYSSLYMFLNPQSKRFTALHFQPAYTTFKGAGREYTTRVVYEWSLEDAQRLDYSLLSVAGCLDRMKMYEHFENSSPERETFVTSVQPDEESPLYRALVQALMENKRLFIRLAKEDCGFGEALLESPKLNALLETMMSLPRQMRYALTLGFGINGRSSLYGELSEELRVVAFAENCPDAAGGNIVVDWTHDKPIFKGNPDLRRFLQLEQSVCQWMKLTGEELMPAQVASLMVQLPQGVDNLLDKGEIDSEFLTKYIQLSSECYRRKELDTACRKWGNATKVEFLGNKHLPLSIDDIKPCDWKEYLQLREMLPEKYREELYFSLEWKDYENFSPELYAMILPCISPQERLWLCQHHCFSHPEVSAFVLQSLLEEGESDLLPRLRPLLTQMLTQPGKCQPQLECFSSEQLVAKLLPVEEVDDKCLLQLRKAIAAKESNPRWKGLRKQRKVFLRYLKLVDQHRASLGPTLPKDKSPQGGKLLEAIAKEMPIKCYLFAMLLLAALAVGFFAGLMVGKMGAANVAIESLEGNDTLSDDTCFADTIDCDTCLSDLIDTMAH